MVKPGKFDHLQVQLVYHFTIPLKLQSTLKEYWGERFVSCQTTIPDKIFEMKFTSKAKLDSTIKLRHMLLCNFDRYWRGFTSEIR